MRNWDKVTFYGLAAVGFLVTGLCADAKINGENSLFAMWMMPSPDERVVAVSSHEIDL